MNQLKLATWIFILLIGFAALGGFFASSVNEFKLDEKLFANSIDSIVHNLSVKEFDEEGKLANLLETPFLQHIPANNVYLLRMPHIVFEQSLQNKWEIWSETAQAFNGGEKIIFKKQVKIHQNKPGLPPENEILMEELTYFPKTKFATTTTEVLFKQPGTTIRSIGMNAYLEEKKVQLLSKTEATYEHTLSKT